MHAIERSGACIVVPVSLPSKVVEAFLKDITIQNLGISFDYKYNKK